MKILFMWFFLFLVVFQTQAQFRFGAKGGFVVSGVRDDATGYRMNGLSGDTLQVNAGALLGIVAQYQFAKWFALEIQPQFVQKGGGHTFGENPRFPLNKYFIKTQYLEFPLLAVFKPTQWLNLEIGPSIGFQLGHTYDRSLPWSFKTTSASIAINEKEEQNSIYVANLNERPIPIYQTSAKIEYAAIAGISFNFLKNFNAGIQYYFAFNSFGETIYFDYNGRTIRAGNLYNRYFSFNLKYYFLKK